MMKQFNTSDGVTLRYALDDFTDPWKTPPTVILLHAVMGDHQRAYRWIPILSRHFRVVRPDMRGHGRSDVPDAGNLTLGRLVRDVMELADHVQCSAFHIAGASVGGIIALQTALNYPERVTTLACFATPPGLKRHTNIDHDTWIARIRSAGLRAFLESTIDERFPAGTDPGFVKWFLDEASRTNVEFLFRFIPMMREVDQSGRLHEITQPTLAVVPGADPHIALEQYEALRQIPRCEFVVYEGLQHNIVDAVPERCAGALLKFINTHEKRTST
ncbi:MAG: cpo [Betaproteobacteria bacterium]|nr:cpo [Betaproteobacteria bacterium]